MLEAHNITFSYQGARRSLYRSFSLQVTPGERVALAAPSGFGKTTLCRLLAGYEQPQEGNVLVDGMPLASFKGASPVQLIGQHPERTLDPLMCMRDALVEAGLEVSRGGGIDKGGAAFSEPAAAPFAVDPKLEAVSLANDPLLVALGIQHRWLTRFPHELSGGELQRFCIARALATNPRYLVADEISTMLDALTQAQLWKFLLGEVEARNMGLVFVSHSPALTARIATRIIDLTV